MKTKFLLPIIALGLFAACNDDSSSPAAADTTPTTDPAVVVDPTPADPATTDPATTPTDPAQTQIDPATNPATTDPVPTDPTPDPVVTPDPVTPPATSGCNAIARTNLTVPVVPSEVSPTGKYNYYGAELSGKDQFKYGRFEACMKMVSIPGSVSSMFLYYDDSYRNGTYVWNEIDIEVLGKGGSSWQSNIITREGDESIKKNTSSEAIHEYGFDATEGFHLYAII
jgi:beta-glucanase (GH16 family)